MSHLTRYPNQFYQPAPASGTTPSSDAGGVPGERPYTEPVVTPDPPPLEPRRPATATSVSAHCLAVLGLDRWSFAHGTR